MTRRPVETVCDTTIRAHFTDYRYLELSVDPTRTTATAIASMLIAGKPVKFAVLVGRVFDEAKLPRIMSKAKVLIQEVVERGSRAAAFLVEARTNGGTRVFIYAASELDSTMAAQWMAAFVARNALIVAGEGKPAAKPSKSKAKPADTAAASA
jgi:hypothetical protein